MIYESFMAFASQIHYFSSFVSTAQGFPKPLSAEEESALFDQMHQGDKEARDKIISHNLRLVAHIVKKFQGTMEADDLISVGTIGLIKAVDSFECGKGAKLSTYASRCISNEILMLLRSNKKHKDTISLSTPYYSSKGEELELGSVIPAIDDVDVIEQVESSFMFDMVKKTIWKELAPLERQVLDLRYGITSGKTLTQREVAQKLGISRSYISRIETKALQTVREKLSDEIE